jgi:hypothetical protein
MSCLCLWLTCASLLASCVTIPPECKHQGEAKPMHCPVRKREATPDECRKLGGVQIYRDGEYKGCMSPDAVGRIMRGHVGR